MSDRIAPVIEQQTKPAEQPKSVEQRRTVVSAIKESAVAKKISTWIENARSRKQPNRDILQDIATGKTEETQSTRPNLANGKLPEASQTINQGPSTSPVLNGESPSIETTTSNTQEAYLQKIGLNTKIEGFAPKPEELGAMRQKVDRLKLTDEEKGKLVANIISAVNPAKAFAKANGIDFNTDVFVDTAIASTNIRRVDNQTMEAFIKHAYKDKFPPQVVLDTMNDSQGVGNLKNSDYAQAAAVLHDELSKHGIRENAQAIPYVYAVAAGELSADNEYILRELVHTNFINLIDDLLPAEDREGSSSRGLGSKIDLVSTLDTYGKRIQVLRLKSELSPFLRGRLNSKETPDDLRPRIRRGQRLIGGLRASFNISQPGSKDMDSEVSNNMTLEEPAYAGVNFT